MLLVSDLKRKLMDFSYLKLFIYIATFEVVVVSSEIFHSLVQNPGKGVNFYGKIESDPAEGLYNGLTSENISGNFDRRNCKNCDQNSLYQDPGIICEIQDPIQCDYSYPYRKYDGSCNNLYISRLGMVNQCYLRFTPPYYEESGGFRKSVKEGPLPEPRDISLKIFKDRHRPTIKVSFQFATFGQFIAFDVVHSVKPSLSETSRADVDESDIDEETANDLEKENKKTTPSKVKV
ncbi:hypothetical protein AVEN_142461-1 [Araneus ventricosus]|uniref:Uncharacterized protein n=1 Tax=Araneus ventricosus TaxID=182803 RepID=A0A4Y2DT42_ARAVE|nr:hypothetical protein AVEN_142461-1 [Araneus ventricosus]